MRPLKSANNTGMLKRSACYFFLRSPFLLCGLISLAVLLTFYKVCAFDFVSWDDGIHVYQNSYFSTSGIQGLVRFWQHPYHSLYIPVSYMAYAALCAIARTNLPNTQLTEFAVCLNPHIFHIACLAVHTINALLVFFLLKKMVKADVASAFGAVMFAVHPLQVESVAWISELRGLLCASFGLSAILVYQTARESGVTGSRRLGSAAIILFALSLLAKPASVMVPFVLLIWDTLLLQRNVRQTLISLIPWFALAILDVAVTHAFQPVEMSVVLPMSDRLLITLDSLGFYIEKLVFPTGLATEYGRTPARVIMDHTELVTIPVLALSLIVVTSLGRKNAWAVPCMLTFFAFLLPNSGLVPFAYQNFSTVADRYVYFAMLGPSLALAFGLNAIKATNVERAFLCLTSGTLAILMFAASTQSLVWRNTQTLFTRVLLVNNSDWLPYDQLADYYLRHTDYLAAEKDYRVVAVRAPADAKFLVGLGQSIQGQKRYTEAGVCYDRALKLNPNCAAALYYRAQCESLTGETGQAVADYRASVNLLPGTSYADYELAMLLGSLGRYRESAMEFDRTIQLHPDFLSAYYYLALTFSKSGEPKLAAEVAQAALTRNPNYSCVFPFVSVADVQAGQPPR